MGNAHYNAFISYRHNPKDSEVAKEIQQQLEHFVIPKAIKEKYGIDKIDRIFKDQEELELTSDLSRQLDENLKNSDFLIVICSTEYNQSKWCLHEVEKYVEYHGRDRVICVLSAGEPPAVFPEILCKTEKTVTDKRGRKITVEEETEPLACDYRGNFMEARRIELPRLAAKIIGCSYDELVMRQEKYRRRRTTIFLTVILSIAALAISYLLWSNNEISRNYKQSMINESMTLANSSLSDLNSGDRFSALDKALSALPGDGNERPVTDEALYALGRASYAYQTPQSLRETWRIDEANDIVQYFVSRNNKYIVCLDSSGIISVYDTEKREKVNSYELRKGMTPSAMEEGLDGQLVAYVDSEVFCWDYLTGEVKWSLPLEYQKIGEAHISHDKKLIAAADSWAVQVMTSTGDMYLSMPLPDKNHGYITDFRWSPDDKEIAVRIRDNLRYRIGVYDIDTSEFAFVTELYETIDWYDFGSSGKLYVVADNAFEKSVTFEHQNYRYKTDYDVISIKNKKLLWKNTVNVETTAEYSSMSDTDNGTLTALGNKLIVFNDNGGISKQFELEDEILAVTGKEDNVIISVLVNGYQNFSYLEDGSTYSALTFPEGTDSLCVTDMAYVIRKNGNMQIYTEVFDDSMVYLKGEKTNGTVTGCAINGDKVAALADRELIFADMGMENVYARITLDQGDCYHIIKNIDNILNILRIDARTADMYIQSYDMQAAKLISETALGTKDFNTFNSLFFTYPLSTMEAEYISLEYDNPSALAVGKEKIYVHGAENPNKIICYNLKTGEMNALEFGGQGKLEDATPLHEPAPLVLNQDETLIFTSIWEEESEQSAGIILNFAESTARIIQQENYDENMTKWEEGKLLLVTGTGISIYDSVGTQISRIPFAKERALSVDWHDGQLLAVYPDNTLRIYREGKLIREVTLAMENIKYLTSRSFRWEYTEDRLYLYCGSALTVINLNSASTLPVYTVSEGALKWLSESGQLLVYSRQISGSSPYQLAYFREYTANDLIRRGKEQLRGNEK